MDGLAEFERALFLTAKACAEVPGRRLTDPTLPLMQHAARVGLARARKRFMGGDRMALFDALALCARHALTIPTWLAVAYLDGYQSVSDARVATWDEAFGRPHEKGAHLAAKRKIREKYLAVWVAVRALARTGWPVNESTFDVVGSHLSLGKTLASHYYYAAERQVARIRRDPTMKRMEELLGLAPEDWLIDMVPAHLRPHIARIVELKRGP